MVKVILAEKNLILRWIIAVYRPNNSCFFKKQQIFMNTIRINAFIQIEFE
jgi:hypothetical protein